MSQHLKHLVFYDGKCGLCDRIVQLIFKKDKKQVFVFAPLQGETAARYLKHLPAELKSADSFILIENYRTKPQLLILAKGALRIAWLLGGVWKGIGWLSFFPGWMWNWAYRLVARNRHHFFSQDQCFISSSHQKERFLP